MFGVGSYLILKVDFFFKHEGIAHQEYIVQFFPVHIHRCDLMIIIGRVVINPFVCVAAGSVNRCFIPPIPNLTASSGLMNRAQNVKKLTDAFRFGSAGTGIHLYKSRSDKTGLRRQVSGQSQRAHAQAVWA